MGRRHQRREVAGEVIDTDTARSYLSTLFANTSGIYGWSWVPTDPPTGKKDPFFSFSTTSIDEGLRRLSGLNGDASGIYVRMTTLRNHPPQGQRGLSADTHEVVALSADLDFGDIGHRGAPPHPLRRPRDVAEALALLAETRLPAPTLVVNSGGGLYPIWRLTDPWPVDSEDDQRVAHDLNFRWNGHIANVARRLGLHHAPGISELARVLRLPGTVNLKDPDHPRPCTVLSADGPTYTVEQLQRHLDDAISDEEMLYSTPPPISPAAASSYTATERADFDLRDVADDMGGVAQRLHHVVGLRNILLAAGWSDCQCGGRPDTEACFTRPGGGSTTNHSAHILSAQPHVLVVWSGSTELPDGGGQRLTALRLYAHLFTDGDESRAARELIESERGDGGILAPYGWGNRSLVEGLFDVPLFAHIRQAAHSKMLDEMAPLLNVLGLRASQIPVHRMIPAVVGTRRPLNLVLGTVGASGSGKSSSHELAMELLGMTDDDLIRSLGSGQGIAEQYMGEVDDPERPGKKVRKAIHGRSRFFLEDEIDAISSKGDNASDAALGEIRKAYTGSHLGQSNATAERNRNVPGGSYRFVLMTNIQPERSGGLFTDRQIQAGTPQRFALLPATTTTGDEWGARLDEGLPEWPGPLDVAPPSDFAEDFEFPPDIEHEIRRVFARRNSMAGKLQSHRQLTKMKLAAVMADLHGEVLISRQWWDLAEVIMKISDDQVEICRSALAAEAAKANKAVGTAIAHQQFETARTREELEDTELENVRKAVLQLLETGSATRTELRKPLSTAQRRRLPEALAALIEDGEVATETVQTTGRPKETYFLTGCEDIS